MLRNIIFFIIFTSTFFIQATGTIIVLHGAGSSGKTSISKILQQKLPDTITVSIDDFFWPELIKNGINRKLITKQMTRQEKLQAVIDHRALLSSDLEFRKILQKLYDHVITVAQNHTFVILDTVFTTNGDYNNFCEITKDIPVFSVLVYCSPIKIVQHVIQRNFNETLDQNRDIFSHMRNFLKLYKKSIDADTSIDTISQQEIDQALQTIVTYAKQTQMKRSIIKEKTKMLQERFEQKFFNKNKSKVHIEYLFEYDIMVNTGKLSAAQCVALIYEKLACQI